MNKKIRDIKPEIVFIIIGLIFGTSFLLINPIFEVPDEPTHYLKSVQLSEGHVLTEKSKVFVDLYSPVPYIVSASVIFIGNLFNLSGLVLFYLGRLANLFFYILIVFMAIKFTPVMKWVFLLLGLMPMTLYEAGSFSADGFSIAISFLLIAFFFKLSFDDKITVIDRKDIFIIFILGIMLGLSKQVYILLLLLFFIIPAYKFESKKKMYINFFRISLSCILIMMGWLVLVKGVYVPISSQVSAQGQIFFILSNPIAFLAAFLNTISLHLQYYFVSFVGTFGWVDTGLDTPLPNILIYAYLIVLILVSLLDKDDLNINLNQKFISLITLLITFVSIFTSEYLLWTVVGHSTIDGIYGRYFIPIAPLFFLLLYNKKIEYDLKAKNWAIIIFISIVLSISLFMILKRFYIF